MKISIEILDKLIAEADAELSAQGLTIAQRPIAALIYVGKKLNIPVPITKPIEGVYTEASENWDVSNHVYEWFFHRYGDKTKMNYSPGRMAVLINEDIFVFRFPLVFGSAYFSASRQSKKSGNVISKHPQMFNAIDSIDDIPDGLRAILTDEQLNQLLELFMLGIEVMQQLSEFQENALINAALSDMNLSVDSLCGNRPEFGQSKWLSLQAIEKILKYVIQKNGHRYSQKHDLAILLTEAKSAGYSFKIEHYLDSIKCTPKIRYGEESCTKREAVSAHHAVFMAAKAIMQSLN